MGGEKGRGTSFLSFPFPTSFARFLVSPLPSLPTSPFRKRPLRRRERYSCKLPLLQGVFRILGNDLKLD